VKNEIFPLRLTRKLFDRHLVQLCYPEYDTSFALDFQSYLVNETIESVFGVQSGKQYEFKKFTSFQVHAFKFFFNFVFIERDLNFNGKENPLDVFGYSVLVLGPNNQVSFKHYHLGEHAVDKFIKIFWDQLWKAKDLDIKMTNVEMAAFEKDTNCNYCKRICR
jgi:hypothetical protein